MIFSLTLSLSVLCQVDETIDFVHGPGPELDATFTFFSSVWFPKRCTSLTSETCDATVTTDKQILKLFGDHTAR